MATDKTFHTRSQDCLSIDQYADEKVAKAWNQFAGDSNERTEIYKAFLVGLLKKYKCKKILDAACGTGLDSIMLIEEGFDVVSTDASPEMLKYALKAKWEKSQNPMFNEWIIKEAHWETLPSDIEQFLPDVQFDAVICLGNSFPHLLDDVGDQSVQKMCLRNFAACLKPGGLLLIDHRNYDVVVDSGVTPGKSIYFHYKCPIKFKKSLLDVAGKGQIVAMDYIITTETENDDTETREFRLFYYPHKITKFTEMLDEAFDYNAEHEIYADCKPMKEVSVPAFYIHVLEKPKH